MKISVVVPSYNQADYLPATLASVCAQDYPEVEVLVFDGGSTDGSLEILQQGNFEAGGQPVRWVSQKDNGQADAINQGLRAATGDVLAYLNSDDVYYPGALATVAAHFDAHPDCLALYGRAHHLHADGSILEEYPTEPWDYERLLDTCYLCQPAVFWRREVVERFGVFDDALRYALDYEYWLRLGQEISFDYLDEQFLAGSRLHADTKTLSQRVPVHLELARVVRNYSPRPEPVWRWVKHLAHHRAYARESADPANPAGRQRFVAAMVAQCLLAGQELNLPVTASVLASLEDDLASVGV
ncbi:MAG: glycosyltransferase [Gluconacetobacter diazotrophicus]|nr:glycosyltransferase [Gluconacetobacter diazotrophicus]